MSTFSSKCRFAACVLGLVVYASAQAADEPQVDADALALEPEPLATTSAPATKLFVEGLLGRAERRYGLDSENFSRVSADLRTSFKPLESLQAQFSARVDNVDPADTDVRNPVLSLREAYLSWQSPSASRLVEFGRINLRDGSGYGYNPTDFLRSNALRTITTINPFTLRETRLGTVMLRGQQIGSGVSVDGWYAPKLESERSRQGISADLGATNSRDRGLLAVSNRFSEVIDTRLSLYKEAGAAVSVGANLTTLVSSSAVAHLEWSAGKEPTLLQRALGQTDVSSFGNRFVGGLTYTTSTRLSLTAEYQHNGFALDRNGWQALSSGPFEQRLAYFDQSQRRQDNAARQAVLLYAVQRDFVLKNMELTTLLKFNRADRSRLLWLDLRYHFDRLDLALQLQNNTGVAGAEFGIAPIRHSVGLLATYYFL